MALNETTNATANATALGNSTLFDAGAAQSFVPLVFQRLFDLLAATFRQGEMLWIVLPLLFTFLVMEFYYDRHADEELGWGAAVANSLILIFVAIDLIKVSFEHATPWDVLSSVMSYAFGDGQLAVEPQVLFLILFLGALGMSVTLINYFHLLPRRMAFVVSSHPPINFLAYFAIAIVYSTHTEHPIPFDMATLIAGALLFVIILAFVFGVKRFVTGRKQSRINW
jgi:hypothetical protein